MAEEERSKPTSVRIPIASYNKVEQIAFMQHETVTDFILRAIELALPHYEFVLQKYAQVVRQKSDEGDKKDET